ncbi:hypothetical protein E4T76_15530 [Enterococcus gallinarum]|nr:hypothetical protein FE005_15845 [Enterococcus sp. M190262]TFV14457.1 hypothetical protein E4T76_15530 [Enterococcus gallinarum]
MSFSGLLECRISLIFSLINRLAIIALSAVKSTINGVSSRFLLFGFPIV